MPIRAYDQNPDFNPAPVFQPEATPDKPGGGLFQFGENWKNMTREAEALPDLLGAAFGQENDVVNAVQLMSQPSWQYDPNFDIEASLKESDLWDEYKWNFVGVGSKPEFTYKANKIRSELAARSLLASAGPDGIVATFIAGAASPTVLLPFVGAGAKTWKAIATGLAWGAVGGAAQEIPLQLNQELRTMEDSAYSIGFSTILGGVLGGAAGHLTSKLETLSERMAVEPGQGAISALSERSILEARIKSTEDAGVQADPELEVGRQEVIAKYNDRLRQLDIDDENTRLVREADDAIADSAIGGKKAAAGADVIENDAGGLKGMLGIGERLTKLAGPVTANLGQKISPVGRQIQAEMSVAGLRREGNLILSAGEYTADGKLIPGTEGKVIGSIPSNQNGTVEGYVQSRRGDTLAIIDEGYSNYSDYWYGKDSGPQRFRNARAEGASRIKAGQSGKLNRRQFFEEVGKAMWAGDKSDIPEVQKTVNAFRGYYDKLLQEAQDVELIPRELRDVAGDPSWLNRVYDTMAIRARPNEFKRLLEGHFTQALNADLAKIHGGFIKAEANDIQRLADYNLPLEAAQKLRTQFQDELKALDSMEDDDLGPAEQLISGYRAEMAKITRERKAVEKELESGSQASAVRGPLETQRAKLVRDRQVYADEVERIKSLGGPDMEARTARRSELKRRIRNMNRSKFMVEEKARAKYEKMENLEEQNIEALRRVVTAGNRALKATEKDAATFEKELKSLQSGLAQAKASADKIDAQVASLETKVGKLGEGGTPVDPADEIMKKLFLKDVKRAQTSDRFQELWDDLENFLNTNRTERGLDEAQAVIQDTLNETLKRVNDVNTGRAKRIAKLEADAKKFDSKAWEAKRAEIDTRIKERRVKVREKIDGLGGDNYDPKFGTADFSLRAKEISALAEKRILGTNVRLAGFDAMKDARGTELARTLSIPSKVLADAGFLVSDAEHLLHVYAQTLIPDIELVKRFGPFAPDGERNIKFQELNEEMDQTKARIEAGIREKAAKEGKPVDEARLQKTLVKVDNEYAQIRDNLDASIRRLRGQWGIPSHPDGFAARGVQIILSMQALRFLGTVGLSSIPDIARPIARYGLGRTLKAAWLPMISNWSAIKLSASDARRAFVAVESATADRAFQVSELMHYARRKTKFEAGLEYATSKAGIVFLFAPWTDLMKTLSSMTFNMKLMDSIDIVVNKAGHKEFKESTEFLASLGLHPDMYRRIADEMANGGAKEINGTWVPQTDKWTDQEAVRAYRAALYSESSATIITPGLELNKVANSNLFFRLLFNLKSFALSSTSKTLMAGLQQRDMALLNAVWISLALGGLSYYLKASAAGGTSEARMKTATWQQWADEALNASGLLGALQLGQQVANDVPGVKNFASFSGGQSTQATSGGLIGDVAGPTMDLITTMAQIITGADKLNRSQLHRVRTLLPLQNWFVIRRLIDQMENTLGDSLNLEGQRR